MNSIVKSIAVAIALYTAGAVAAVLPRVSTTEVVPNKWTSNMEGALAAAKTTNLPIFLVMINDSSTGQGCQHCMQFVNNTLNTENFANLVKKYQFYMVLLNYWSSPREPAYGGVSEKVFDSYFNAYQSGDNGYPQVVLIKPNGARYAVWSYKSRPVGSSGPILYQYIDAALANLAPKKAEKTIFALSAQSSNTVVVQSPTAGVWTGVVTRSGKSGKTGSVGISLEGANKSLYELSTSSLTWDSNDGTKTFTVKGPSTFNGIVSDDLTVKIAASGFTESDISYETSSQTVTFKDSRVKQSLADFAAAHTGLDKLSASGGTWYVPSQNDGNVLETVTSSDSTLEFTASVGGVLTATLGTTRGSIACTTSKGDKENLLAGQSVRFGVAVGDKITFKASASEGASDAVVVGFKTFSFTPLTVTLSKPAANAQISYGEMLEKNALVDLAWGANRDGCTFSLTCGGVTTNMGSATSGNALDLGLVAKNPETKEYTWSVRATYSANDMLGQAIGTASSKFKVAALPAYDNKPLTVTAYKSFGSAIDMSVDSSGVGDVSYAASGLPKGMKMDAKTGVITGTPMIIKDQTVTVTAKNDYGTTSKTFTLKVTKFPKSYTTGKYAIYYFNDKDEIVASGQLKLSSRGKWTASVLKGGVTTKLQGLVSSQKDGDVATGLPDFDVAFDTGSKMWSGTASGYRVYGKAVDKPSMSWKGNWNLALASSSNEKLGGWVTAKVGNAGKVSIKGRISENTKIAGGSFCALFPESFVRANLPRWAGHGDVRFGHTSTRTGINVGCALFANGGIGGHATSGSQVFDSVEGSRWNKGLFAGLNGKSMVSLGGGDVTFKLGVSGKKPSFNSTRNHETIACSITTGQVKVSYRIAGKTYKASGVVYAIGGQSKIFGGGTQGGEPFVIKVE